MSEQINEPLSTDSEMAQIRGHWNISIIFSKKACNCSLRVWEELGDKFHARMSRRVITPYLIAGATGKFQGLSPEFVRVNTPTLGIVSGVYIFRPLLQEAVAQ